MGLRITARVLQKTNMTYTRKAQNISDDVFELWSRRAIGGVNPINPKEIRNLDLHQGSSISLWQKFKNLLGIRRKVNSQTFSSKTSTANIPYVASRTSVEASNSYIKSNVVSESEKIVDGFRDGGRYAQYDKWGKAINASREVVTVDLACDKYLQNVINYAKKSTQGMNEKQKAKFIYNLIIDMGGDVVQAEKRCKELEKLARGQEVLLGKIFEKEATVCRHKSLMFKILADELGLQASMVRGNFSDMFGVGGHAWNEVIFSNGKKFIFDTQNSTVINISKGQVGKKAAQYLDINDCPMY